jgi:hypothetical protein
VNEASKNQGADPILYGFGVGKQAALINSGPQVMSVVRRISDSTRIQCHFRKCRAWSAPGWQAESSRPIAGRCSHVFGLLVWLT